MLTFESCQNLNQKYDRMYLPFRMKVPSVLDDLEFVQPSLVGVAGWQSPSLECQRG